ncbi:hypothetical protein CPLU01_02793 [Colletotrichum plurivorum]|uniref:Uncharacterized protein n=1 Tax=Colletotrichum plurivorum TaxID=2175906 RepID=A0A8H6KUG5_9PEZI|nr:hypothetical protein CPLU01_02793 [Colletotrichum plurivorum]
MGRVRSGSGNGRTAELLVAVDRGVWEGLYWSGLGAWGLGGEERGGETERKQQQQQAGGAGQRWGPTQAQTAGDWSELEQRSVDEGNNWDWDWDWELGLGLGLAWRCWSKSTGGGRGSPRVSCWLRSTRAGVLSSATSGHRTKEHERARQVQAHIPIAGACWKGKQQAVEASKKQGTLQRHGKARQGMEGTDTTTTHC